MRSAGATVVLQLFEEFYDRVYWFARRSVDAQTAEDISQEVFVRLMRVPEIETREITVSYLLKVADNLIKRRHRQCKRQEELTDEEPSPASAGGPDARAHDRRCEEALGRLTEAEREALRLIVCEGLSYEAAARALDVKVSTVNNWKFRGIQKLRELTGHRPEALVG